MNLRDLGFELIDLCDELEQLRFENKRLAAENEAYRLDQLESLKSGQRTAANWLAFIMDKRVKWERHTVSERG